MSGPAHEEAALILRCREGDQDAIRQLVESYQARVYYLVWRSVGNEEDARDITQETFVRALRALDTFDITRPFRNWLFRIASNLAIDHHRRRHMRTVSLDIDDDDPSGLYAPVLVDEGPGPDEQHERARLSERLARLVERLSPGYRRVIHLRHNEQLSYNEIAQVLDVPLGTVKARLHRAHHRLRDLLAAEGRPGAEALPDDAVSNAVKEDNEP